jgi:hypothetical protein
MMGKKVVLVIKNLETEQNDCFVIFFSFFVNKKKKNYKGKFSTNLILKNKTNKDNLGRKKTHEEKRCSN